MLNLCLCLCLCADRGVGCCSVWLPRSDCRGSVFPQGGADPSDRTHRLWVEERKTGGEGRTLPCCLHSALPRYNTNTHIHTKDKDSHQIHQKKNIIKYNKHTVYNHNNYFLFPAQPIPGQQPAVKGVAAVLFDFTAESEDELTLKVCVYLSI